MQEIRLLFPGAWQQWGQADFFEEERGGYIWQVVDTGGDRDHYAGLVHLVRFERPIEQVHLSVVASLYTQGGGLMLRLGIDPEGHYGPGAPSIRWSGWYGPDNGWSGQRAQVLRHSVQAQTERATFFLQSRGRWRAKNTARWRDVQLVVEYAEPEPEPPEPEPPPTQPGIPGQIAQALAEIQERLDRIDNYLAQWDQAQSWTDTYNENKTKKTPGLDWRGIEV